MMSFVVSLIRAITGFLLSLPRFVAIAIVLVVVLFIGFGAYGSFRVYSYTQDDPTFCRSCHTMEKAWNKWATSEHSKVNCHSCHESSPVASFEQVIKYSLDRPNEVAKHATVPDEACENCHMKSNGNGGNGHGGGQWAMIADTAGHKVHAEDQNVSCLKCHSVTLHRFAPPEKICLACHGEKDMTISSMGERYCLDCHNFLRENSPLRPQRQDCLKCHETQTQTEVHWPTNAPMQFQCGQCHQPHKKTKPADNCVNCHQDQKTKGNHAVKTHASAACNTCHKPHEWKITQRETCTTCHANKVDHNPGSLCATCHNFKG